MLQMEMPGAVRTVFGKGGNRRLRAENKTPAVIYQGGEDAMALEFDAGELYKKIFELHGRNAVITLKVDGDQKSERHVLVKEMQKDPVHDTLIHVDFLEISLDDEKTFTVPLRLVGTAKGVDLGGELQVGKTSVTLKGKPLDIPDVIEGDITNLGRGGETLTCGELNVPENVAMLDKSDAVCAIVY